MNKIALLGFLAIIPGFAQQPRFELADVHASNTAYWFAQNNALIEKPFRHRIVRASVMYNQQDDFMFPLP